MEKTPIIGAARFLWLRTRTARGHRSRGLEGSSLLADPNLATSNEDRADGLCLSVPAFQAKIVRCFIHRLCIIDYTSMMVRRRFGPHPHSQLAKATGTWEQEESA